MNKVEDEELIVDIDEPTQGCLDPPMDDENGTWSNIDNKQGSITTLTCNEGYEIIGDKSKNTMTCDGDFWGVGETGIPVCGSTSILNFSGGNDTNLDSRCRRSTNLFSFYMTELNGINVLIKLIIIGLYFRRKKKRSLFITGLIILLSIHTLIHILIIISSLPQFCDSSNDNWIPGKYFNFEHCHKKNEIYYSLSFWFIDTIVPGILAIYLLT